MLLMCIGRATAGVGVAGVVAVVAKLNESDLRCCHVPERYNQHLINIHIFFMCRYSWYILQYIANV